MVVSQIQVRMSGSGREVIRYVHRVRSNTKKYGLVLTKKIAKSIARRARRIVTSRGPHNTGTGALYNSIKAMPSSSGKSWLVTAGRGLVRPYDYYQEFGFRPHFIHKDMVSKGSSLRRKGKNFFFVSRHTPFMGPAFRYAVNRLDADLNRTANKIIRG